MDAKAPTQVLNVLEEITQPDYVPEEKCSLDMGQTE